jgi:hypothetical protein
MGFFAQPILLAIANLHDSSPQRDRIGVCVQQCALNCIAESKTACCEQQLRNFSQSLLIS